VCVDEKKKSKTSCNLYINVPMKTITMSHQKIKREFTPKGVSKGSLKRLEILTKKKKEKPKVEKQKATQPKRRHPNSKRHKLLNTTKQQGLSLSTLGGALTKKIASKRKNNKPRTK